MSQWDDIKYFFDYGIAYKVELIKSKNNTGTYSAGTDSPRFGWGIDGTQLGTISESAAGIYTLLDALGAHPEIQIDLMPIFSILKESTKAKHIYRHLYHFAYRMDKILGANAYIIANSERLSEHVQDVLGYLLPQNVFMEQPTIDDLGSLGNWVVGAGLPQTDVFTDGAAVDVTQFGNHNLYIENTKGAAWGASSTDFNVTVQKFDGTQVIEAVQMPGLSPDGTKVDIGTHGTDMYVDVIDIEATGGRNTGSGDEIDVYCEEERAIDPPSTWWT